MTPISCQAQITITDAVFEGVENGVPVRIEVAECRFRVTLGPRPAPEPPAQMAAGQAEAQESKVQESKVQSP